MLTGSIDYKGLKYDVEGMDNLSETRLRVISKGVTAFNNMVSNRAFETDNEIELDSYDGLNEHRLDIKVSRISVDSAIRKNSAGKNVKAPINEDFWCRLGALIRYAKQQCTVTNELGYTGLQLASNDIETCPSTEYEIKFPMDKTKVFARVTLFYGVITDLHIQTDDFKIDLTEDNATTSLLTLVKNGYSLGIKFDEEYLGFPLPKQAPRPVTTGNLYQTIEEVIAAHPEKEFSWLLEKNYQIVTDENLEEICKYIMDWDGYVFYDTETTGLNITFKSRIGQADQLVGVVLSVKYGESFFFPTQMKAIPNLCGGDHYYFMEHYMRPILEGKKLITHNGEFDWKVAYIYDINCNIVHDTMWLIALTLGASRLNWRLSLKENAHLLLHRDSLELSDLIKDGAWGEDSDIKFWDLPYNLVRLYACADTDNTQGLFKYAMETDLLGKYNANKVYQIEINFMFAVAYQEFYGHKIDITALDKVREDIAKIQENTMAKMEEIAGKKFNPNSPAQLIDIMYHQLGIPEQISRKTGRPTTDKDTIKKLAEMTNIDDEPLYPFASYLSEYRQAEAVRKIIDNFPKFATSDGYVFSSVNQTGASTGRVSINDPNYQSYNDPIKKHVVPRPGYYMFDTDYSSIEYRVLANMVGNKRIMTAFADPDFDYHAYQAAHMYGVPYSAVTKKLRKAAKGINFGLPYGMGDESLGARVFGEPSAENTIKARELRKAYFNGQEDIRDWFEHHRDKGINEGFTETYFGRRRYYNRQNFTVNAIRRQAGNQVIQGCLHGDTKIETKEFGVKPIKELVGYSGFVWNGTDWTHGDVLYSGKKQKCIITFEDDTKFICSPIHKFLLVGKDPSNIDNYVECKDLTDRHFIECNISTKSSLTKFSRAVGKIADIYNYNIGLKVKSVEITDEYIDMYDVCNTDCGYYVADGLVTHNTAADLYKIGVGRLFKRICKEGWLGKVLFSGFIHDELLGEVSVDINPADFLRVIREEYEVKVVNEDGTPWCPLYMGFGYGRNWYEAKSVEWSIKLQWEWVKKYGKTGYPLWHQNPEEFCNSIPDIIRDFEVRDIRNQILDENSQGKEIKPTLNNEVLGCCKEDSKMYKQAIKEFFKDEPLNLNFYRKEFEEYLDKTYHIQSVYLDEQGNPLESFEPATTTQSALDMFCKLHKTDRSQVNLLDIPNVEVSNTNNTAQGIPDMFDMNEEDAETARLNLLFDTIKRQGVFTSVPEHKFYVNTAILLGNAGCLNMLKTFSTKYADTESIPPNEYTICQYYVDPRDKEEKIAETLTAIPSDKIGFLTQLFTSAYYKL